MFQDPQASLDPVRSIGHQLVETIRTHLDVSLATARERAVGLLREVGLASPERRIDAYPHELSGGMRQRAVIALALCADPALLVADEPTSALDVATQARLIELLRSLCRRRGTAVLLITHDLGVVADAASRLAIMYAGRIVEIRAGGASARRGGAPLCGRPDRRPAEDRPAGEPARRDRRQPAGARGNALRLRFPPALPEGHRPVRGGGADAGAAGRRAQRGVLACPRGRVRCMRDRCSRHGVCRGPSVPRGPGHGGSSPGARACPVHAVVDVSLRLRGGTTLAVVGESGCGKSTLARLVAGLIQPTAGQVLYAGRRLLCVDRRRRSHGLGPQMIFQDPACEPRPALAGACDPVRGVARRRRPRERA